MRAAVDQAASSSSSGRLPRLLFGGRQGDSALARLDARLDELVNAVAAVVQEVQAHRQLLATSAAATPPAELEHAPADTVVELLFVPSPAGYRLVEQEASAARGDTVRVDGVEHRVAVVRRSPLLDWRRCAYLEPA